MLPMQCAYTCIQLVQVIYNIHNALAGNEGTGRMHLHGAYKHAIMHIIIHNIDMATSTVHIRPRAVHIFRKWCTDIRYCEYPNPDACMWAHSSIIVNANKWGRGVWSHPVCHGSTLPTNVYRHLETKQLYHNIYGIDWLYNSIIYNPAHYWCVMNLSSQLAVW